MNHVGRIQWWDEKYGRGVIEDGNGIEYYFDSSVIKNTSNRKIQRNQVITFKINKSIVGTHCAFYVVIPTTQEGQWIENSFVIQTQKVANF